MELRGVYRNTNHLSSQSPTDKAVNFVKKHKKEAANYKQTVLNKWSESMWAKFYRQDENRINREYFEK